ncbi:MAG TPA: aspartate 1-decarboxylase, partial [Dehalococcoidia bacterium]|nr:aspartate 1-decarboxylase [Dehalococcoidia bacterium]
NGAAARLVHAGDIVIILTYREVEEHAARAHRPRLVYVDARNRIVRVTEGPPAARREVAAPPAGRQAS